MHMPLQVRSPPGMAKCGTQLYTSIHTDVSMIFAFNDGRRFCNLGGALLQAIRRAGSRKNLARGIINHATGWFHITAGIYINPMVIFLVDSMCGAATLSTQGKAVARLIERGWQQQQKHHETHNTEPCSVWEKVEGDHVDGWWEVDRAYIVGLVFFFFSFFLSFLFFFFFFFFF